MLDIILQDTFKMFVSANRKVYIGEAESRCYKWADSLTLHIREYLIENGFALLDYSEEEMDDLADISIRILDYPYSNQACYRIFYKAEKNGFVLLFVIRNAYCDEFTIVARKK